MLELSFLGIHLFVAALYSVSASKTGKIEGVLTHYETLHTKDILHGYHKRDASTQEKVVSFTTLGRHFKLHLIPHVELFSENFHAYSVGENNEKIEIAVDKDSFYKGFDEGDPLSHVRAHVDDGVLSASIDTKEDTYVIEPAWRHVEKSTKQEMIAYRHSDVKSNITHSHADPKKGTFSFCGHDSKHSTVYYKKDVAPDMRSGRKRRAASTLIRCTLALVADFTFFKAMGGSDKRQSINYMIGVADRVDKIYRDTEWSSEYKGYGFEITEVTVHTAPGPNDHYNMDRPGVWPIKELLRTFSKIDWSKYCLAHLFTYQDFADGVIGLAYVGNPKRNAVGGICTERYFTNNMWLYLNTGLSSSINWGRKLLTEEADIVTAHEIGHNFGSEHDPETQECAPADNQEDGGKYIMYPASVSGQLPNNKVFSPCSRRRILEVLKSKSEFCFTEPRTEICGNYRVEKGEECDPGGIVPEDSLCCTKDCKLKKGALCSDGYDWPCCKNCTYTTTKNQSCRIADTTTCSAESFCDGNKPTCPDAPPMSDGTPCIDRGVCKGGKCKTFCEAKGLQPCKCSSDEDACKVCCQQGDTCIPYRDNVTGVTFDIADGRSCQGEEAQGTCLVGRCQKNTQDLVERFWTFLTTLDSNIVAKFMKDNLAGTVVVFSLLIWIPASCYINRLDNKKDKQEALEAEWRDSKNTQLLRQPKPTSRGKYIYRQDSITRSSRPDKPFKVKPKNIKTRNTPKLEYTVQTESNL